MTDSWLERTGQGWKIKIFWLLIGATALLLLGAIVSANGVELPLGMTGLALLVPVGGFSALLWLCAGVVCKTCGAHPAWEIIKGATAGSWWIQIESLSACPKCGD